jgi:hypothetical protein
MKLSSPRLWFPVAIVLCLSVACDAPTGPGPAALAGTYRLEVVNGRSVPDTAGIQFGSGTLDGTMVLLANGGASRLVTYRDRSGSRVPAAASGTFEVRGNVVELKLRTTPDAMWRVRGEVSGSAITLHIFGAGDDDVDEVYRRQ